MTGLTVVEDANIREIASGVWWLANCVETTVPGYLCHNALTPYLIVGSSGVLLFDTGPPGHWPQLERQLDSILGARSIDWIVPSHPEVPHCGNVRRLLRKYPAAMVVGDVRDYHLFFPDIAERFRTMKESLDLGGGKEFSFLPAVAIHDHIATQWGYERSSEVLFVADAFGVAHHIPPVDTGDLPVHLPGECTMFSSELEKPPELDQISWINERALYWMRYTRIDPIKDEIEALLEAYPTRMIAPAHGAVLDGDYGSILAIHWDAYRRAYRGDG
jgi:hypothetical protein